MATFTLAFLLFAAMIGAMSIGIMFGRPRIEGSCGGLNRIPGVESDCGGRCRKPCAKRRSAN
jgi:hypothetical protein